ncbi:MAG TPA: transposase [bacterium]|nr:transposase [bacterium]
MNIKHRRDFPGLEVHVIVNAPDGASLFRDEHDKRKLGERFAEVLASSDVQSLALAIMDTHVHAQLVAGAAPHSVGKFMKRVWAPDSRRFNARHGRRGHRIRSQYFRIEIRRPRHSFNVLRYVLLNPLLAGMTRSLRDLETYRWTSLPELLGTRPPAWISREAALRRFGDDEGSALERARAFLAAGLESRAWREDMNALLWRFPGLRPLFPSPDVDGETRAIVALACTTLGVSPDDWIGAKSAKAWSARGLAAWLLTERLCLSQKDCAARLGVAAGSVTRLRGIGRELALAHSLWIPELAFEPRVGMMSDVIPTGRAGGRDGR